MSSQRPEGFAEDVQSAANMSLSEAQHLWRNLASGAESGWDFSSRWLYLDDLSSIHVTDILPVDLNAILYANEMSLSVFHCVDGKVKREKGHSESAAMEKSSEYLQAAMNREKAMNLHLWKESKSSWADYNVVTHTHRNGSHSLFFFCF